LRDFLFSHRIQGFPYSIIISIVGFISFILFDYYEDNRDLEYKRTFKEITTSRLWAIGAGNFLWFAMLLVLFITASISYIIFFFFFYLPHYGIISLDSFYFDHPSLSLSMMYNETEAGPLFLSNLSYVAFYFFVMFLSFARVPKNIKTPEDNTGFTTWFSNFLTRKHNTLSFFYFLFLVYLTPMIFQWLYAVLLCWFGSHECGIRLAFIILSYIFIAGLMFTLYKIIKNNRNTRKENVKQEIREELLDEIKNPTKGEPIS